MGHVASIKETKNAYKFLVTKPEGLKQLGEPKCYRVVRYNWSQRTWRMDSPGSGLEPITGYKVL